MDDSKKSVTAGARGEFTMTSDQRPTERTYPVTSHPPLPRRAPRAGHPGSQPSHGPPLPCSSSWPTRRPLPPRPTSGRPPSPPPTSAAASSAATTFTAAPPTRASAAPPPSCRTPTSPTTPLATPSRLVPIRPAPSRSSRHRHHGRHRRPHPRRRQFTSLARGFADATRQHHTVRVWSITGASRTSPAPPSASGSAEIRPQQPADGGDRDSGPVGDGRHGVQLCVPGEPRSATRTPATR